MNTLGWLGLAGLGAAVTAGWSYIKTLWMQISGLLIVTFVVEYGAAEALLIYLGDNLRLVRVGPRLYHGTYFHVKSLNRVQLVAFELLNQLGALYFSGWKPLWIGRMRSKTDKDNNATNSIFPDALMVSFLRGMWDADTLVNEAVTHYNRLRQNPANGIQSARHFVKRVYGISHKRSLMHRDGDTTPTIQKNEGSATVFRATRPVGVERDDLGRVNNYNGLDSLALSPQVTEAVKELRRWIKSETWYRSHGVPWRRSWQLNGRWGNGKTALARCLAEELDLPLFIFDLASLANDEMQAAWSEMLSNVPCMALLEDIDNIFDGRKTLVGDLTFDCLLNCLDGIERADGLFVVITTNHPEKIDPSLGVADSTGRSTRPGRVDRALEMTDPDEAGRMKIITRILAEWPLTWPEVLAASAGETGAQIQERCSQLALRLFWETDHREAIHD